ncbi:MAG: hypothetical protein CBC09_07695 [Cellvibrionales bacterium TMED49]|nr:colicin V production CvpA [Porticoccaceae bacterium]OUU37020.1 MAG: hypothetical protein CBC09_07695 [Cellvibrionales bacterium TMED49]|tara:strand:+ start:447 stop:950 length:504 start_codon:yes stop_codon:yes gene_type:complete
MTFVTIDYAILSFIFLTSMISVFRGFFVEALSLITWICAFMVTMSFNEIVADMLVEYVPLQTIRSGVSSVALFITTLIFGSFLSSLVKKAIKNIGLGSIDSLLGFGFGFCKGALIVLASVIVLPIFLPITQEDWWSSSVLIPLFEEFEQWGIDIFFDLSKFLSSWSK